MDVIIVSPNLDPTISLGGVSAVSSFIVDNNKDCHYIHFELGKRDSESGGLKRLLGLWNSLKAWKSLLHSHPNAVIHYNFPLSPGAIIRDFFFMKVARKQRRRMVVHVHGGVYMNSSHIPFVLYKVLKHIFHWDAPFIVLSEHEKEVLSLRFSPQNVYSLPNCVELNSSITKPGKTQVLTIGYLGRITEAKGMRELLEACKVLLIKGIPFKLKIAGVEDKGEPYVSAFTSHLGNCFEYDGVISGNTKKKFLNSLDVFVLPSYFEGLPVSLLESMSYGAVPVVTPVGSIPEVVKDGVNGLLIEVHSTESIVNAIIRLQEQNSLRAQLSEAAKITIEEQFNPKEYIEKLNMIYQLA